jgi:hypothetical protein
MILILLCTVYAVKTRNIPGTLLKNQLKKVGAATGELLLPTSTPKINPSRLAEVWPL